MEKNKQILALFTTAGILHGVAAQQIVASQNGGTLMLSSVALVLYGLITISNRFIEQRDTKKLFPEILKAFETFTQDQNWKCVNKAMSAGYATARRYE